MVPPSQKRPRRKPLTQEEVSHFIALRKRRELIKLHIFKASKLYKVQNLFNILCFFLYWELILCFFGPSRLALHHAVKAVPTFGEKVNVLGKPIVDELDLYEQGNPMSYKLVIDDYIPVPPKKLDFLVGRDYIIGKELKAKYLGERESPYYRLFAASPVLFLSVFVLLISTAAYSLNLNQNSYSLMALSVLNLLTLLGILCL